MGKVTKFAFSAFWRAILIVPIVAALFLFAFNQKIENEDLRTIASMLAITLSIIVLIGAAGAAGDYPKSKQSFFAYMISLFFSSLVGISGVLTFFLIIVLSAGQLQSIPSIIDEFSADPSFILISGSVGIGYAWFMTIATWFEKRDD